MRDLRLRWHGSVRALRCQGAGGNAPPPAASTVPAPPAALGVVSGTRLWVSTAVAGFLALQASPPSAHVSRGVLQTPTRAPIGAIHLVPAVRSLEVDGRGLRVRIADQPVQITVLNDA